jgi:phosphoglycerol transferase MdoB-like AlkP superfamily enzyme
MTISGHANYSFSGNAQSKAHKDEVEAYCAAKGLDYSSNVKAYLACQIEVELMMKTFITELGNAGILDDTVFVLVADHFPYGLSNVELAQLYGLPSDGIRSNFDLYRNSLIIWSSSMEEPVTVDVPCSAIDVLPTVSNLFALPYDSRLMMGVDVFSDQEPLVVLNCDGGPSWNWINKYGSYRSGSGFTVNPAYEVDKDSLNAYVKSMSSLASARKKYAFAIFENDYYAYVFGKK